MPVKETLLTWQLVHAASDTKLLSGQTVTSENGKASVHLIVDQADVKRLSLNDDTELAFVVLPSKESNNVFHQYLCNGESMNYESLLMSMPLTLGISLPS